MVRETPPTHLPLPHQRRDRSPRPRPGAPGDAPRWPPRARPATRRPTCAASASPYPTGRVGSAPPSSCAVTLPAAVSPPACIRRLQRRLRGRLRGRLQRRLARTGWRDVGCCDGWPVGRDVGWLDGWPVGCWVGWPRRLARRLLGRLARAACPCATVAAWAPPCFATWAGVVGGPWAAAWACRDGWRDVDWRDGQAGGCRDAHVRPHRQGPRPSHHVKTARKAKKTVPILANSRQNG